MPWTLVTAPDERTRCCFVDSAGVRCERATVFRVSDASGEMDAYTFVCGDHVHVVADGRVVERV